MTRQIYTLRRFATCAWSVLRHGQRIGELYLYKSGYREANFVAGRAPSASTLRRLWRLAESHQGS